MSAAREEFSRCGYQHLCRAWDPGTEGYENAIGRGVMDRLEIVQQVQNEFVTFPRIPGRVELSLPIGCLVLGLWLGVIWLYKDNLRAPRWLFVHADNNQNNKRKE